jgi:hypothetical protein
MGCGVTEAARPPSSPAEVIATAAGDSLSWISLSTRSKPAPPRSILLTKMSVGMRNR